MAIKFEKLIDSEHLLYFMQKISTIFVRKDGSKTLTTNDFTDAYKTKLDGIASGAQVNTLTGVKGDSEQDYRTGNVNITAANIGLGNVNNTSDANKPVSTATQTALDLKANLASPEFTGTPKVPTATAGDNSTKAASTAFVATAITNALSNITGISFQVVTELPQTGTAGVFYLLSHSHGTGDAYDEYVWVGSGYEKIGHADLDLSGYVQDSEITVISNSDIDTIIAGE